MEVNEQRRAKLRHWIDTEFEGRISAMCRYYALQDSYQSYINQMVSGHRNIGERAARALERRCGRPEGWLDTPVAPEPKRGLTFDAKRVAKLPHDDIGLIEGFIRLVLDRHEGRTVARRRGVMSDTLLNYSVKKPGTNAPTPSPATDGQSVLNITRKSRTRKRNMA